MLAAWKELAGILKRKVNIAEMDCDAAANKKSCASQRISGFPTLIMCTHSLSYLVCT